MVPSFAHSLVVGGNVGGEVLLSRLETDKGGIDAVDRKSARWDHVLDSELRLEMSGVCLHNGSLV